MQTSRRNFLRMAGAAAAASTVGLSVHNVSAQVALAAPPHGESLGAQDRVLHLLNRITYGPRPEEVERARHIGVEAFLDEQLNPQSIDDSAADAVLAGMPILFMSRAQVYALEDPWGRSYRALANGLIQRGVHSRRQLLERVVDFWSDHFNAVNDDIVMDMVGYYRDAIRAHALGSFRDMVLATAMHPAMLQYLNNAESDKEHPNENYARELMELHTLGVDGGYTEQDVKEVARAFTGWTVQNGRDSGFYFNPEMHDDGPKTVLGYNLPAGRGIEDGLHVISILVNHPSTARFISRKLLVRFVTDDPSPDLVERTAQVWADNRGAITPVLRFILTSEDFFAAHGQKLRRPLEFYIGALRATGTELDDWWRVESMLNDLAQPPYGWHPPNGYPDVAGAWKGTSSLLARWNTATTLTHEALSSGDRNIRTELLTRVGSPTNVGELVDAVSLQVFGTTLPAAYRDTFIDYAADGGSEWTTVDAYRLTRKTAMLYSLMLASPLYQWR